MEISTETIFNNIRSVFQAEVNKIVYSQLENEVYNTNMAQIWTNKICDDVKTFPTLGPQSSHQHQQKLQVHI